LGVLKYVALKYFCK